MPVIVFGFALGFFVRGLGLLPEPPLWLAVMLFGVLALAFLCVRRLAGVWAALAASLLGFLTVLFPAEPASNEGLFELAGVVTAHVDGDDEDGCDVRVTGSRALASRGAPIASASLVRLRPCDAVPGSHVRGLVKTSARVTFRNRDGPRTFPDPFRPPLNASVIGALVLDDSPFEWPRVVLARARTALRERLTQTLHGKAAGLALALVLGDASRLDDESLASTRMLGLSHVLAVSGMHVVLVVGAVRLALRALVRHLTWLTARVPADAFASGVAVPLVLAYAEVAGGSPSAWRAAWMSAIAWSARATLREPDARATFGAAFLVQLVLAPRDGFSLGFWLSMAATWALIAGPRSAREGSLLRRVASETWQATWRCTVATLPIVVTFFAWPSPLSLVANLALAPIGGFLVLPLATLHALVSALSLEVGTFAAPLTQKTLELFLVACDFGARWSPDVMPKATTDLQCVALTLACAAILLPMRARFRVAAFAASVALACADEHAVREARSRDGTLRVTMLDVGQGDGLLVEMPDGRVMMVDVGGAIMLGPDPGERAVVPVLRNKRVGRIDVFVASHPHPDHVGALATVAGAIAIGEVWDTGEAAASGEPRAYLDTLGSLRRHGTHMRGPSDLCGRTHPFGGATVEVLAPCPGPDALEDTNDNSFVLRLTMGERSMLLTGDIEERTEARLVASGADLHADVLKVAHHGSRTSTTEEFLRAVSPSIALVSAGHPSPFHHPHPSTTERLRTYNVRTLTTGECGSTELSTTGSTWSVDTFVPCAGLEPAVLAVPLDRHSRAVVEEHRRLPAEVLL
jgi:competence protein ComEC